MLIHLTIEFFQKIADPLGASATSFDKIALSLGSLGVADFVLVVHGMGETRFFF